MCRYYTVLIKCPISPWIFRKTIMNSSLTGDPVHAEVTGDFYAWQTQLKISDPSDAQRQNFQAWGEIVTAWGTSFTSFIVVQEMTGEILSEKEATIGSTMKTYESIGT